jgi:hypothetical protein
MQATISPLPASPSRADGCFSISSSYIMQLLGGERGMGGAIQNSLGECARVNCSVCPLVMK